jgi:thiol-disulfide isomerase/thioredoxin
MNWNSPFTWIVSIEYNERSLTVARRRTDMKTLVATSPNNGRVGMHHCRKQVRLIAALPLALLICNALRGEDPPVPIVAPTEPVQEAPPGILILEGQLTDPLGSGAQDVTVSVSRRDEQGNLTEIATATTNEFGDFQVRGKDPIAGLVVVRFAKSGHAPIVREITLDKEAPPFLAEELLGDQTLIGRILNAATGTPREGATITAKSHFREWRSTSDASGRFELVGWSPGQGVLIVEAEGFGRETAPFQTRVGPSSGMDSPTMIVELRKSNQALLDPKSDSAAVWVEDGQFIVRLRPERLVRLTVVDQADQPISGVAVETFDSVRQDSRNVLSDVSGSAVLKGVHFDTLELEARLWHADFVSSEVFDRRIELPADQPESHHVLKMQSAGRISGKVTDVRNGEALYGARIITGGEASDDSPRDWTTYEGTYLIRGVPPGRTLVTIHLSGFAPELETVEVKPNETATVEIAMVPATTLKGRVRGSGDKPIRGAMVSAGRWRGHGTLGLRAMTDSNGEFILNDAPKDEFELVVSAPGHKKLIRAVRLGSSEPLDFLLDASAGGVGDAIPGPQVGDPAPEISVTALDGSVVRIPNRDGKLLVVDFWATWCAPCVTDVGHLLAVYEKFGGRKQLAMLGISLDDDESVLRGFIQARGIRWPQAVGESARAAADRFGVQGIPALFLIGPDGKVLAENLTGAELLGRLEAAFEKQPASNSSASP